MEAENQKRIPPSIPVIAILAILAVAFLLSRSQLKSTRPETPYRLEHAVPHEDKIDARLWQDPFKVVLDHEKAKHSEEKSENINKRLGCPSTHDVNQVSERINTLYDGKDQDTQQRNPIVQVLLTIVRDGTFAEDRERRLRNRYAVLTALSVSAMAPEDSKHIQFFKLQWTKKNKLNLDIRNDEVPKIDVYDEKSEPLIVPFEWFRRTEVYPVEREDDRPEHVMVVWLPESAFSHKPLTRIAQVIDALGRNGSDQESDNVFYTWFEEQKNKTEAQKLKTVQIDVIGPSYSDTLQAMLKEAKLRESEPINNSKVDDSSFVDVNSVFVDVNSVLVDLTIFSPWSTASPALLVEPDSYESSLRDTYSRDSLPEMFAEIPDRFSKINIKFIRMIGSDDLLVEQLIGELYRRGVDVLHKGDDDVGDHVALISEWDTFYGKTFPLLFATAIRSWDVKNHKIDWPQYTKNLKLKAPLDNDPSFPENLHTYKYIKGVDGKLPKSQSIEEKQQGEEKESESKWTYSKSLELPIGTGQLDYVRRLAQNLKDEHERRGSELKAIGVIGSDVYDKLILLHALREQFDDVIIFMTDLDARMMHYEQFKWTRNVIVASNFGLGLDKSYQSGVYYQQSPLPPFRDNYQTALFFACRTALGLKRHGGGKRIRYMCHEPLTDLLRHPRLFEIGRGQAVDLSIDKTSIHPERDNVIADRTLYEKYLLIKNIFLTILIVCLCILLLMQISQKVRKIVSLALLKSKKWDFSVIGVKLAVIGVILFSLVVIIDHHRPGGEPFSLFAGISIWPGEVLRLIVVILGIYFIFKSLNDLDKNKNELCDENEFGLCKLMTPKPITFTKWHLNKKELECSRKGLINWSFYRKIVGVYYWIKCWVHYCYWIGPHEWKPIKKRVSAQLLWREYLVREATHNRFHRVIAMCLTYVGLGIMLMFILGFPNQPYRGYPSLIVSIVLLILSVSTMIILMFFVVDATRLCLQVVYAIIEYPNWPKQLVDKFKEKSKLEREDVENWLDVQFIDHFTKVVVKLIYYPFIILLIMILARNRYFDNWNFPFSLVIVFLVCFFHALGCAIALQRAAGRARQTAVGELQRRLNWIKFTQPERSQEIEYLIRQIEALRQGAFRPFLEKPIVHVLFGSGSIGLLTLLRFFYPS